MKTDQFFRCLADKVRLKVILLLWQEGELSTVAIAQMLGVNENMIKRNMALLSKHQIVLFRQKELFQYCRINPELPIWVSKTIKHTYRGNKQLLDNVISARIKQTPDVSHEPIQKYSA